MADYFSPPATMELEAAKAGVPSGPVLPEVPATQPAYSEVIHWAKSRPFDKWFFALDWRTSRYLLISTFLSSCMMILFS